MSGAPVVELMELGGARKRRKWDVAAPQGVPAAQTATGLQGASASVAAQPKPGQPLTDDLKARAQQAAAAAVAKISQASEAEVLQGREFLSSYHVLSTFSSCRTWFLKASCRLGDMEFQGETTTKSLSCARW